MLSSIAKVLCVVGIVEVVVGEIVVVVVRVEVVQVFIVGADFIWRKPLEERFSRLQFKIRSQPCLSHFVSKLLKIKISENFAENILFLHHILKV